MNTLAMKRSTSNRQGGFSIVEIMVAMLLGIFLVVALVQILIEGKESFTSANYLSRLQENGRIASNMIVTDLKRAGYLGANAKVEKIGGSENRVPPDNSCANGTTDWGRMVENHIEGLDDTDAGYNCITSYLRGDIVAVRYASPWVVQNYDVGRLYLRSNVFDGAIFLGQNATDTDNNLSDNIGVTNHELLAYAYYIGDSNRVCGGQPIPSLYRVRLDDNGQPVAEELLPGIEDLQVQYSDGLQYVNAGSVTEWKEIKTARIWILVRSECPEQGFTDTQTYSLGNQNYTPGDNFRRQLYSSVVMLRNYKEDDEPPPL